MSDHRTAIATALANHNNAAARTQQSRAGILGPSDIGFCRQKAVLVTRQVQPTDKVSKWSAMVGTALHNYIEAALKEEHPEWILGSIDELTVTATLPSGARISGHPDIVIPAENTVLDIKTVDGFEWIKRQGSSQSHKYQRHLYAMGCYQAGIFDPEKPIRVGNVYFDRSGKDPNFIVISEEFDPSLTAEVDAWVQDVIYASANNEDASRDVAAAVCERICEFFTVCRGGLDVNDGQEFITDSHLLTAIDMYLEGDRLAKEGDRMKKEAKQELSGVNGTTGEVQVRWVHVNATTVPETTRAAYDRLDVRKSRSSA